MKVLDMLVTWFDERTGLKAPIMWAATHAVPPGSKWFYVFGTAVLTSFIVQIITGVALATLYVPAAGDAYQSIKFITSQAPFGNLLRAMHFFGASSMIIFVGVHALRTYLMGAYKFPRELNWLSGVFLLFLTVAMGFTGQVLRWDQTAVWTVAVGAEQAMRSPVFGPQLAEILMSGKTIGSQTLSHFFAFHVFVLPGILIGILVLHLWLILHNGISEPPVAGNPVDPKTYKQKYHDMIHREGVPFWPDAAWRDIVFSTIVVIFIVGLSLYYGPPAVEKPPDPSLLDAQPKPDWYLLWYFAILAYAPHKAEDYIIIGAPVVAIVGLLLIPFINNKGERALSRRPWAIGYVILLITMVGSLLRLGITEPWTPAFSAKNLTPAIIGTTHGPVYDGAQTFDQKGCLYCHMIAGHGGNRGPNLTYVGDRLTRDQVIIRIVNGGYNMPAYAGNLTPKELSDLAAFLESRKQ